VAITREQHPFEGQSLSVIHSIRRRGVRLVLVILPNGTRSLIPAAWTDWKTEPASTPTSHISHNLGRLDDLLHLRRIINALLSRPSESAPHEGSSHAIAPCLSPRDGADAKLDSNKTLRPRRGSTSTRPHAWRHSSSSLGSSLACSPLRTHYSGRNCAPGYHCSGEHLVNGRGSYCLNIGGVQIDEAITRAFIAALEPAKLTATVAAAERLEADREAILKQWQLGVERASYEASRAERRYRAVDPDNRLVARGLEREWEESLSALEAARAELARREQERPRVLSETERRSLFAVGADINAVWNAPTTLARDRKELLRTLLEEVIIKVERDKLTAHLTMRWGSKVSIPRVFLPMRLILNAGFLRRVRGGTRNNRTLC
jgi:hypothetical protein